jgi:hypothetical protein
VEWNYRKVSQKTLNEDIGLPTFMGAALSNEMLVIISADRNVAVSEDDRELEQRLMADLKMSLTDEQLELVSTLQDHMANKESYIKEFIVFSGVKQGISFYKEYQSI